MTFHTFSRLTLFALMIAFIKTEGQTTGANKYPFIWADVPDIAIVRAGDTYYMSSTTMHMNPGLPLMKSKDLVNWEMAAYAYDTLVTNHKMNLEKWQNAYGAGSWASSIRHHDGKYFVSTFSSTSGKTHIYETDDIEGRSWTEHSFSPALHDHSLFFDDDGRVYLVYGAGSINLIELKSDLSGPLEDKVKPKVIIKNASSPAGERIGLAAEGSQMMKVNGKYYLFNITWPKDDMRVAVVHRADKITGPYEGRVFLRDRGIAQGSIIDSPEGDWYTYLFRDYGAVGRAPYLMPVSWVDGWPVVSDAELPEQLIASGNQKTLPTIVASDEFERKDGEPDLAMCWQWNHNPDNANWSLRERDGFLRIRTARVDSNVLNARNTLTQRSYGPTSSASTALDVRGMKTGDYAGLMALQQNYAFVGVKKKSDKYVVVVAAHEGKVEEELTELPLDYAGQVYLKLNFDFSRNEADEGNDLAYLHWSLDGNNWNKVSQSFKLSYTLPHFMGYRFALFNFSTEESGGAVDFDYFRVGDSVPAQSSASLNRFRD